MAPTLTNGILPYATVTTDATGLEFATYGANGIAPLTSGPFFSNNLATALPTQNVKVSASHALTTATTINGLLLSGNGIDISGTHTLTVTSGAILNTGGDNTIGTMTLSLPNFNEVGTITLSGATGGTFQIGFNGATTGALAFNATAAAVQSALEALTTIGAGNVAVTGSAGGPYTVTFQGALGSANQSPLLFASALTPGTATITYASTDGSESFISAHGGTKLTINSPIGGGSIRKGGDGTVVLAADNSGQAGVILATRGILHVENATALGSTTTGTIVFPGGALAVGTVSLVAEPLTIAGRGPNDTGALQNLGGSNGIPGNLTLAADSIVRVAVGTLTVSGIIGGTPALVKTGTGALVYAGSAANTHSGTTVVAEGSLILAKTAGNAISGPLIVGDNVGGSGADIVRLVNSNQILDTALITVGSSGLLDLAPGGVTDLVGALTLLLGPTESALINTGTGTLTLNGNLFVNALPLAATTAVITGNFSLGGAARTFTIAPFDPSVTPGISLDINGALQSNTSALAVTQVGRGTMRFSGVDPNTHGPTTVNEGTLILNKVAGVTAIPAALTVGDNAGAPGSDVVRLNAPDQIANGINVTINSAGYLDLANAKDEIGGLGLVVGLGFSAAVDLGSGTLILGSGVGVTLSGSTTYGSPAARISGGDLGLLPSSAASNASRDFVVADSGNAVDLLITSRMVNGPTFFQAGLSKFGSGTLLATGTNTFSGPVAVNAGTLHLTGSNSYAGATTLGVNTQLILSGNGQIANSSAYTVNAGATLLLDNTTLNNPNRLRDAGTITLLGGTLSYLGAPGALSAETIGTIVLGTGASVIQSVSGLNAGTVQLVSSGLVRSVGNGTVDFQAGTTNIGTPTNQVVFTNAPALSGGILPFASVNGADLATHNGAGTSIRPVTNYVGSLAAAGPTDNVRLTASEVFNGSKVVNSLVIVGEGVTLSGTGSLTLASGQLVASGRNNTVSLATLHLGGSEGIVQVDSNSLLTISSSVVSTNANALTKSGLGTLTLSGSSTYTGTTRIEGGFLLVQSAHALGSTAGATIVSPWATLQVAPGLVLAPEPITLNGTGVAGTAGAVQLLGGSSTLTGPISLASTSMVNVPLFGQDLTLSGIISGSGGLTKLGTGTLILSGTNTFTGATSVGEGILVAQNDLALGGTGGATTVVSGATLAIAGGVNVTTEPLTVSGTGLNSIGALVGMAGSNSFAGTITLNTNPVWISVEGGATLDLSGATASNANGILKIGTGTLIFSGLNPNLHTGATTINEGTLLLNKAAGVNAIAGALVIGDTFGGGNADVVRLLANNQIADGVVITINTSGLLDLNNFNDVVGAVNTFLGPSYSANITTGTGLITLGGAFAVFVAAGTVPRSPAVTVTGNLSLGGADRLFTVNDGAPVDDLVINGPISGSGGIIKWGTGNMVLAGTGTSNFSGTLTLNQGVVTARNPSAFGAPGNGVFIAAGAALQFDGNINYSLSETLLVNGSGISGTGAIRNIGGANTFAGPINLLGTATIALAVESGTLTLGGTINTTSNPPVTKDGPGALVLTDVAFGTSSWTVTAGSLGLAGANGRLDNPSSITVGQAAQLTLDNTAAFNGNRLPDTAPILLNGGSLNFLGNDSVNSSETVGTVTLSNAARILSRKGTGANADLVLRGLVRNAQAGVAFIGQGGDLGLGPGNRIRFINSPAALLNNQIFPFASVVGSTGLEFATLDGTHGIRALGPSDSSYITTLTGAGPTHNVRLSASATASTQTINGLLLAGTGVNIAGFGQTLTIASGALLNSAGSNTLSVQNLNLPASGTSESFVSVEEGGNLTVSSMVTSGYLLKQELGNLTLAGANTNLTGTITIGRGTLTATQANSLGTSTAPTVILTGAALQIQGNLNLPEPVTVSGAGINGTGAIRGLTGNHTLSGTVTLVGNVTIGADMPNPGMININAAITGTGNLTKVGSGILNFQGISANTYVGTTTVLAGTLALTKDVANAIPGNLIIGDDTLLLPAEVEFFRNNQIADAAIVTVNSTGVLDYDVYNDTINVLSLRIGQSSSSLVTNNGNGGILTLNNSVTLDMTTTAHAGSPPAVISGDLLLGAVRSFAIVDSPAPIDLIISGQISGAGSFTMLAPASPGGLGGGTLLLTGSTPNTFTGTTTVQAGVLLLSKAPGANAIGGSHTTQLVIGDGLGGSMADQVILRAPNQIADVLLVTVNSSGLFDLETYSASDVIGGLGLGIGTISSAVVRTGTGTITLGGEVTVNPSPNTTVFSPSPVISGRLMLGALDRFFTVNNGGPVDDLVVNAVILSASAGITKAGAGTMVMGGTAANTYLSGNGTWVIGGSLKLAKSNALGDPSNITTVVPGASLQLQGGITVQNMLQISGWGQFSNFTASGALENISGSNTWNGQISMAAATTINVTAGTLTVSGSLDGITDVSKVGPGTLVLAGFNSYVGALAVNSGVVRAESPFALGIDGSAASGTVVLPGGALAIAGGVDIGAEHVNLFGRGVGGGALVNADNLNTFAGPIQLHGFSTGLGAADGKLYLNGTITGASDILKLGAGVIALGGTNSYTGTVTIANGAISVAHNMALGSTSAGTFVSSGASLQFENNVSVVNEPLTIQGAGLNGIGVLHNVSGTNSYVGTITALPGTMTLGSEAGRLTLGGILQGGSNGVAKVGSGIFSLAGSNAFTGPVHIFDGTLEVNSQLGASSAVTVHNGGTLGGTGPVLGPTTVHSGGSINPGNTGPGTLTTANVLLSPGSNFRVELLGTHPGTTYDQLNVIGTITLNNANLVGTGALPLGALTLTLINNDGSDPVNGTFAGLPNNATFTMAGRTFTIDYFGGDGNDVVITALTITRTWDGGSLTTNNWSDPDNWTSGVPGAGDVIVFAGTLRQNNVNDLTILPGNFFQAIIFLNGGFTLNGNPVLLLDNVSAIVSHAGVNVLNMPVTLTDTVGTSLVSHSGSTLTIAGNVSVAGALNLTGAGVGTITGSISGPGSLSKTASGNWTLAGTNTFAGPVSIAVGTLIVQNGNAIPNGSNVDVAAGATLDTTHANETIGSLSGNGNVLLGNRTLTTGGNNGSTIFGGVISGSGSLTKAGSGVFTLTGANTYTGTTTISGGTLQLGASGVLADSTLVSVAGGATFDVGGHSETIGALTGGGVTSLAGGTLTTGGLGSTSYSGPITGSGHLVKVGTSTFTLTGTHSWTGTTTVAAGTLSVLGLLGPGNTVTVGSGAVLAGTGTIAGPVFAQSGGTIYPGVNGLGILDTGSVTFASGSSFQVRLSGTTLGTQYDQLRVTGSVDLTGALLIGTLAFTTSFGQTFTLIDNDGTDPVVGTFANVPDPSNFTFGSPTFTFTVQYNGGDGNDVVLIANAPRRTWDGGGTNDFWTNPVNWVGDVAPNPNDILVFAGTLRLTNTNNFPANTPFQAIVFDATGF
ncbi:MAG: autotransporter-associated beta strand repeat-containing protein, partial [Gemmataceae bacterium]|nr:autotransporter-associated beta strand repeat-containing protein [Gemmataceae bacterium]